MMKIIIELTEEMLMKDIENCQIDSLDEWKEKTALTIASCAFPDKEVNVDIRFIHE